jgi:hypothetical protein
MVTITFFMVSSSFSAFFLDIIEEDYNTDTPLAFHPLKSAFAACSCDFIFFLVGPAGSVGHCPVDTSRRISYGWLLR